MEDNAVKLDNGLTYANEVDLSVGKSKKASVKNILKQIVLPTSIETSYLPTSNEAYLTSKYKTVKDNQTRFHDFVDAVVARINAASQAGHTICHAIIPDDILNRRDEILDIFRSKGYIADILPELDSKVNTPYLIIVWEKFVFDNGAKQ